MAGTLSYMNLKSNSAIKDQEEKRSDNREKAMLLFAFQLLIDKGYLDTATCLTSECSFNLEQFSICENIDLRSVFVEFESYYNLRYQRYPQYFKKATVSNSEALLAKMKAQHKKTSTSNRASKGGGVATKNEQKSPETEDAETSLDFQINGRRLSDSTLIDGERKLIKPISGIEFPTEDMRFFAEQIQREIVVTNLNTKWSDVIGLGSAKMTLQETLVYAKEFSEFFGDGLTPWKGLLLYGPPGVGKTLLAKAVASECGTTFFNISSASIVSKWRGDSEKIVKILFEMARYHAPSTIFFDEFDALGSNRDSLTEGDASRRLKSEILQQMDGLLGSSTQNQLPVFILAATNLPWELDSAIVRRMEKRIYVPLPGAEERRDIFKLNFEKTAKSVLTNSNGRNCLNMNLDLKELVALTEGYSGSDINQIIKETLIRKFRHSMERQSDSRIRNLSVGTEDVLETIQCISPTVKPQMIKKFNDWSDINNLTP